MKKHSFSIITVSYNQNDFIVDNIESILRQKMDDIDHIIIDGGSTDGTIKSLKRYKHLNWISEPDRGQSHGLNKGFRKAKGDIIGWINSDDMLCDNALENVNLFFNENPKAIAVVGNYVIIDDNNKKIKTVTSREYNYDWILNKAIAIAQPSTFFRKEVFEKVGFIDESYHYAMDREFFLRITKVDKIHYLNKELAYFRVQANSKTSQGVYNFAKELLRMRLKYGGKLFDRGNRDTLYIIFTEPFRRIRWLRNLVRALKGVEKI
jgi:GT2 family glycosyltransferase